MRASAPANRRLQARADSATSRLLAGRGWLRKPFWAAVAGCTVIVFAALVTIVVFVNNGVYSDDSQDKLSGLTVSDRLTVHTDEHDAPELRFESGDVRVSLTVDSAGLFSVGGGALQVATGSGAATLGASLDVGGTVTTPTLAAATVQASSDGFHFPDGTVMTTAASVTSGLVADTDLNLGAGALDGSGAVIVATAGQERLRVTAAGDVHIRDPGSANDTIVGDLTQGISFYPAEPALALGDELRADSAGLRAPAVIELDAPLVDVSQGVLLAASVVANASDAAALALSATGAVQVDAGDQFALSVAGEPALAVGAAGALSVAGGVDADAVRAPGAELRLAAAGAVVVDAPVLSVPNVTAGTAWAAELAAAAGSVEALSAGSVSTGTLEVAGAVSAGSVSASELDVAGSVSADAVSASALDVSGAVAAGSLSASALDVAGAIAADSAAVTGAVSAGSVAADALTARNVTAGALAADAVSASALDVSGAVAAGSLSASALDVAGAITADSAAVTGALTVGGALTADGGLAGVAVAQFTEGADDYDYAAPAGLWCAGFEFCGDASRWAVVTVSGSATPTGGPANGTAFATASCSAAVGGVAAATASALVVSSLGGAAVTLHGSALVQLSAGDALAGSCSVLASTSDELGVEFGAVVVRASLL